MRVSSQVVSCDLRCLCLVWQAPAMPEWLVERAHAALAREEAKEEEANERSDGKEGWM